MKTESKYRDYLSLFLLFTPAFLFSLLVLFLLDSDQFNFGLVFLYLPFQFWIIGFAGIIATIGGYLDWQFHRKVLKMKISEKERNAEAAALGLGGIPMFVLMALATISKTPNFWLIPILLVLIYTVVAISYDEFVFHIKRCGKLENTYHRMLVFGNGVAWLAWIHFIYCR